MYNVLIVEDEEIVRTTFESLLSDSGYSVTTAVNGQDGIDKVREQAPDIIMLDTMMPVKDGFEFLKELKNNPVWNSIPVVVLTNIDESQGLEKAKSLGAVDYLVKSNLEAEQVIYIVQKYAEKNVSAAKLDTITE